MKKVLSMTMLTILATTLAVSACSCKDKATCPCAVKPAVTVKPAAVVAKPAAPVAAVKPVANVTVVAPEVKKVEEPAKVEVKKSFAQKLKFWAK